MLSNCEDCKYFSKDGCAINPVHWNVWDLIQPKRPKLLNDETRDAITSNAQSCQHFQVAEDLQIVHARIGLPLRTWRQIAEMEDVDHGYTLLIESAQQVIYTCGSQRNSEPDYGSEFRDVVGELEDGLKDIPWWNS
jgi:hypothetical protein